ncbi:unnamed protein product, partial [Polarella glacialis]
DDPLPPIESYISPYDVSKRRGEEVVLNGNGRDGLFTCCLRAGGIIIGPGDFIFRQLLQVTGGVPVMPNGAAIDYIHVTDLCCAMLRAAEALPPIAAVRQSRRGLEGSPQPGAAAGQ